MNLHPNVLLFQSLEGGFQRYNYIFGLILQSALPFLFCAWKYSAIVMSLRIHIHVKKRWYIYPFAYDEVYLSILYNFNTIDTYVMQLS